MSLSAPLVLGTAGHVDHGKTTLIGALTGTDTDRLAEEKRRGVSIELGYARLDLPSGRQVSVVDVPGHERFIRAMVAGATGVDLFLMCVAADDGVMPQTREHLIILEALGISDGVVAITKVDRRDSAIARSEIGELLPAVETVDVAVPDAVGVGRLAEAIERVAARLESRAENLGAALLHVDRSFSVDGVGTVVTGTLWKGSIAAGDRVTVMPHALPVRVRSVQVHDTPVEHAAAGQRVALALSGVSWRQISRGDVVCADPDAVSVTHYIDVAVDLGVHARPLAHSTKVQVHHGTRHTPARVIALESESVAPGTHALCQLRLDVPLVVARGDRMVLRELAPPDTIGGATVLDPAARRHGRSPTVIDRLRDRQCERPVQPRESSTDPPEPAASPPPARIELDDGALRIAALLVADGARPRSDAELAAATGLTPPETALRLRELERAGRVVRGAANLHFDAAALERLAHAAVEICRRDGATTVAAIRDELATSRRYALAILHRLDARRVTVRHGDRHVLRERSGDGIEPSRRGATSP